MKHIKRDLRSDVWVILPGWTLGWDRGQNATFSEYGHVAYQIKRIDAYSNMVANILPADSPPPPSDPGGGVKRLKFNFFQNMVNLHIKLNEITYAATW